MPSRSHLLLVALALGLLVGTSVGAVADDVSTFHEGDHEDSDGHDDGNLLPAPGPILALGAVGLAAVGLRRAG